MNPQTLLKRSSYTYKEVLFYYSFAITWSFMTYKLSIINDLWLASSINIRLKQAVPAYNNYNCSLIFKSATTLQIDKTPINIDYINLFLQIAFLLMICTFKQTPYKITPFCYSNICKPLQNNTLRFIKSSIRFIWFLRLYCLLYFLYANNSNASTYNVPEAISPLPLQTKSLTRKEM